MACQVGNYQEAERHGHARLKPYRVNRRREFFELPIGICSKAALDECNKINEYLGLNYINPVTLEIKEDTFIEIEEYHRSGFILFIKDLLSRILDRYELKPTPLVVVTARGRMLNAQLHINN